MTAYVESVLATYRQEIKNARKGLRNARTRARRFFWLNYLGRFRRLIAAIKTHYA
jgi:hypothetical protein